MFTSKEILERTGISRATLNNYISSGLLPRPDVLPPDPADGSAPRIGYFPDDTITRILEIQRLKSEGWSMGRIAQHFAGGGSALPVPAATPLAGLPAAAPRLPAETVEPGGFFEEVDHPAYGLGPGFELLWANAAVQGGVVGRLLGWPSSAVRGRGILDLLLAGGRDPATDDLVGFHLLVARQRGLALETLCRGLTAAQADGVARRLQAVPAAAPGSIPIARVAASGFDRGIAVHALHLRTGAVILYAPPAGDEGRPAATVSEPPARPAAVATAAPRLAAVAVLAARLQDAEAWWRRLPAAEFVELMADLRATLDPIVARHGGQPGLARHAGFDVLFVGGPDGAHLPQAVAAAQALREAVRVLSRRWQVRKGWAAELHLNCGLADGHEWIAESHLLGDAAQEAAALAHAGGGGSVWATRTLVDRLPAAVRDGLRLAAPVAAPAWAPVDGCYARLRDLVEARGGSPNELNPRFADLSVAVLAPAAETDRLTPQAARPPRNG